MSRFRDIAIFLLWGSFGSQPLPPLEKAIFEDFSRFSHAIGLKLGRGPGNGDWGAPRNFGAHWPTGSSAASP